LNVVRHTRADCGVADRGGTIEQPLGNRSLRRGVVRCIPKGLRRQVSRVLLLRIHGIADANEKRLGSRLAQLPALS
jgi:hypothetical protein